MQAEGVRLGLNLIFYKNINLDQTVQMTLWARSSSLPWTGCAARAWASSSRVQTRWLC